ncbi:unnamed protein product [Miscanthus lutarioriparius]|uniref:Uncharacterized protein n=1 Tax=Miscanthus lutarioriparius TaxID=422564 RepID=A0A811MAZ2_9POAL|nr:unnamed protein product [Miscanthus lutarioriparius]
MPERPSGQKATKKAALAAKGKSKGSNLDDDGKSKESVIDVEKLDKFRKIQDYLNANLMKLPTPILVHFFSSLELIYLFISTSREKEEAMVRCVGNSTDGMVHMPIEIPVQPIAREVERRPASTEERIGHGEHTRHRHLQLRHHLLRGGHGEVTVAKEQHTGVVRSEMQYENWCMLACITKESVQADRRGAVGGGVIRGGHAAQHGPQRPRQQVPGAALCGAVGHSGECGRGPRAERLDHGSAKRQVAQSSQESSLPVSSHENSLVEPQLAGQPR